MLRNARQDAKMRQVCMTNSATCTEYFLRKHVFVWHIQGSQRKSFASGVFLSEKTSKRQGYPLRCLVFWFKMGIYKGYPSWLAFLNSGRDKFKGYPLRCSVFWFKMGIYKGYPWWFAFLNSGRDIIQRISFASLRFGTQAGWIRQGILYVFSVRSWQTVIEIDYFCFFWSVCRHICAHETVFLYDLDACFQSLSQICCSFLISS